MSRTLLVAAVWAVLIAVTALLAHLAGPEPRPESRLESATIPSAPVEPVVDYPAPIAPQPEARVTYSPPTPGSAASPQSDPKPSSPTPAAPPPARPKRTFPKPQGASESGIPGLGSLPPGPGAAYQGLGVQVYSRRTGQPVAGARVRYALQAQLDEWQRAHPETPLELADPESVLEICTKPVQSRDLGVALTDSAPGRMLVDARSGGQYGFAWVDRDKEARARIDLVEDRALTVHVTDVNGVPRANTAVLVRDSSCAELWRSVTDANGSAHWKHASFLIERDASPGACVAMLQSVDTNPRVELIRRPHLAEGEFVFLAQPSGTLLVNVIDAAGAPVLLPLVVTCSTSTAVVCRSAVSRALEHGVATFDLVQPGLELSLEIDGKKAFEDAHTIVRGPNAPGVTRTVTVTCGRRLPIVRARLVGPDGKPLAKVKTTAWLEFEDGGRVNSLEARERVESDDAGAVRFSLSYAPSSAKTVRLLIVAENEFGDWCHAETIGLATAPTEWELDLGERHLVEMPTLAAGYVLADRGWPVPNAIVEVSSSDDPAADPESFTRDARFDAVADQMGRFRLRGLVAGSRIALTASAPEHMRPLRRIVERGERKIALELTRCASMSGKILLAPNVSSENTHVWIDLADESIPAVIGPSLTWRCTGLQPGTVGVRVTIDGLPEPVYSVPSLALAPGIEFSDPQTTTIDLRTRVTRIVLRVLNANDMPIASGTAVVTELREEGPATRTVAIEKGMLEVLALRPTVDIEIRAAGFESRSLRSVASSDDVKLVPVKEN